MNNVKVVAMDMDGTLTQHKSPLGKECRLVIEKLREKYTPLMVCAGGCERVCNQLEHLDIDILGFYGMQTAEVRNGLMSITKNFRVKTDYSAVSLYVEKIREEFGFFDYLGDSVEFHSSGLITLPILGTKALSEDKLKYDPDRSKRRIWYDRVCEIFNEYNVFIGGTSSFDIAPRPYNKLYALKQYLNEHNYTLDDVVFFGDDYGIGGNDQCVYESGIKFVKIDNYLDFPKIAKNLLIEE